jgi:hypothetical protein
MSVVVVIPIYKNFSNLNFDELSSLRQCLKVLNRHQICIVSPIKLSLIDYKKCFEENEVKFNYVTFDDKYFNDISGYNQLLINQKFYKTFIKYNYMLIYQPDCWVFEDELLFWCSKSYDYIGAPWVEVLINNYNKYIFQGVGNGGFSLRKISTAIRILESIKILKFYDKLRTNYGFKKFYKTGNYDILSRLFCFLLKVNRYAPELDLIVNENNFNEDIIWSFLIKKTFRGFNIPIPEEALKFSFEVNPFFLYKMNNDVLPFGCHAWRKYDPNFWSKFIF